MTTKDYSKYNPRTRHLYVARDARVAAKRKRRNIHARGGGDVRRRVIASGGPRKATAAEKARYASRAIYTPRLATSGVQVPSPVYKAMGLDITASKSGWDTNPVRTYDGNNIYVHPVNNYHYILGPNGQVAQYQWGHKRLYAQIGSGQTQTTTYPSWFDKRTIDYIKSLGGLTSDPFYSRN